MRISILSAVETYLPAITRICDAIDITVFIGLSDRRNRESVAGYFNYESFCAARNIPYLSVDDYTLTSDAAIETLAGVQSDLILVLGWQRLLPGKVLSLFPVGAVGVHGSAFGITGGRGRSPLNWALIAGAKEFHVSIFLIEEGIDDGKVLADGSFEFTDDDDIASAYEKLAELTADLIISRHDAGRLGGEFATSQTGQAGYLPMRLPEDGAIDWNRTSMEVVRFIRALSRPYPGAFTELGGYRITVWTAEATPLPTGAFGDRVPGTILDVNELVGTISVRTCDAAVQLSECDIPSGLEMSRYRGQRFSHEDFAAQMDRIIARHVAKYPDLPVAPEIQSLSSGGIIKPS